MQAGPSSDHEDVKVLESNLKTKHMHKSRQIDDGIPKEPEVSGVAEPSTLKPPMVKKRKKKARKLPNLDSGDGDMKKMKDVPLVEIKQPSLNARASEKEQQEGDVNIVVKKATSPVSASISPPLKYEQSKQFAKSRFSYALPERMQRFRRSTALGDVSTSPELSLSDIRGKENLGQISGYEFFVKEWFDQPAGRESSLGGFISHLESQSGGSGVAVADEALLRMLKTKRHRSLSKRAESTTEDTSAEINQENQPLLAFNERTKQDLLVFGRLPHLSNQERIQLESKFLYDPPDSEVPVELKTGGQLPRYLEDEGFFISKLPYVAPTNLRRLENRIISEIHMDVYGLKTILTCQSADDATLNGKVNNNNNNNQEVEEKKKLKIQSWFREDGMLNLQSNPLKNIPSRPSLWNDQFNPLPEKFQIFYVQPLSPEMTQNYFSMQSEGSNCQNQSTFALNLSRNKQAGKECRLDVDIRRITFDFHPLFSLEHVYAQNLRQIVQAYELALSRDQVNACIQRISALKRALKQLEGKRIANESTFNEDQLAEIDCRIEDYYHEISLMRRARNHAEAYEKGLLASALRAWKRVKEARVKSGCTNTTVRLKIAKQMTNVEQDLLDWNQELDEIVSEAKHQFDIEYQEAQRKYEEEMEVYKQEKKKLDAALRRQRLRESGQTDELEDNPDIEREDAQILAKQKLLGPPPTSPRPFDAQIVRDEAEINLKKCRRLYNEPKVTVSLLEDAVISSNAECPKNELNRRFKMLEYAYFIKLYYNGKLVETTQPQLLTNYFTLDFRWILPIQIRHQPESIVAKLFEKHGWKSYQIGEFYIAPPSYEEMKISSAIQTTTTTTATTPSSSSNATSEFNLQCLRFTITTGASFKLVQSSASLPDISSLVAYVGLGGKLLLEALDGTGEKTVSLPITGTLYAMAKWVPSKSILNDLNNIEANSGYLNRRSAYMNSSMKKSTTDLRSLLYPSMQMYQSNQLFFSDTFKFNTATTDNNNSSITNKLNFTTPTLDPNNTMDSKLLNIIQTMSGTHLLPSSLQNTNQPDVLCHTRAGGANYFHLDYALERYNFCTDEDLDKSKRLRLFRLRQNRVPGFQNIIIPSYARHISEDIFDSLNEKKSFDTHYSTLKGMKAYKQRHKMYIDKIKNEVNQHFQEALNKKSLREIVIEEEIPNILFLLPLFKRLFEPKRPLRPKYQERRRIGPQYVHDCGLQLIVTIHGAYNLPIRSRKRTDQSDYRDNKIEDRNNPLKPFVEVKFQQHKKSTIPSEGRNPSWNTEFRFGFFLTAETPNLECMKDPIIINVYDQVTFSQAEGEQQEALSTSLSSHYIQRVEHHLIGSTEVPLSTIYLNSKVSGRINLSVPIILQGYETVNLAKSSIRPMVDVLMTLEPSIYPPAPLMDSFMTTESVSIQSTLTKWYEKLSKHKYMSDRLFKPLVMNSDCHEVLMTRFLYPLNPPEDFLPGQKTGLTISESMLRLARYVSLIPYEPDAASFPGLAQVWCTCDQFLSMLRGDEEEHAVLLACYFMYILKFNTMDNTGDDVDTSNVPTTSNQSFKSPVTSVYLCIGEAVPEGRTVYIMTEDFISQKHITESINWRLWNPVTGQNYSVHDVNNPLRSVWGLVNSQNILANIQQKKEPWELVWDLTSTKCWLPVFSKTEVLNNSSASLETIQPKTLLYASLESREVEHIKFELETVLRDALMDWRKTKITRLNYEFIKEFNKMLENLEKNNGAYYDGLGQLLDRISSKYHIYGFPMNFSYMEPHEIIARVKSKGIHELIGSEFTLADVVNRFHQHEEQQQQPPRSSMAFSKTTLTSLTDSLFTVGSGSHKASLTPMRRSQADLMNDIQFTLNVYVKAYPGPVLSIWIYLAGLWRRASIE